MSANLTAALVSTPPRKTTKSAKIDARVDAQLKQQAAVVLHEKGLSFSDAINQFLAYVAVLRRLPDPHELNKYDVLFSDWALSSSLPSNVEDPEMASWKKLIERAAELENRPVSTFIATAAKDVAQQVIERETVLQLSMRDQQRFAEALLQPAKLSPSLQRARERREQREKQDQE